MDLNTKGSWMRSRRGRARLGAALDAPPMTIARHSDDSGVTARKTQHGHKTAIRRGSNVAPTCSDGTVPARRRRPNNQTSNGAPPMRRYPLAASIALIVAGMSFNAAAQSVASDQELAELRAQIAALQAKVDGLE